MLTLTENLFDDAEQAEQCRYDDKVDEDFGADFISLGESDIRHLMNGGVLAIPINGEYKAFVNYSPFLIDRDLRADYRALERDYEDLKAEFKKLTMKKSVTDDALKSAKRANDTLAETFVEKLNMIKDERDMLQGVISSLEREGIIEMHQGGYIIKNEVK